MSGFLYWINQHARALLAAGVFLGILAPVLADWLRPLLPLAVIGTLTGALLRLDWGGLAAYLRRPRVALVPTLWQLLLTPLLIWGLVLLLPVSPELGLGLVLQAAAPPIGSAAVFAMLLGINASLSLVLTVSATLLLPLSLTPLVALLTATSAAGTVINLDLLTFFARVSAMVLAPFAIAGFLRRFLGVPTLRRHDSLIGALNVLLLVIFAIAVMQGVGARLTAEPAFIGFLFVVACAMALMLHILGYLVLLPWGRNAAINAAVCSGNRNMGLVLAVTAGSAGETFSLYVGVAQIPMYFAPLIIAFVLRRLPV
ncbi:MAG: bile acid:sodium symporter [Candidatus Competibacteraceae bacterium]|nr:bile acid:sodium symporter [Candidatus Competibacteraceae bacterium]MCB1803870.1 bile acid:sodium symporter [Candidatus Competibacteraceae bacterium]MCB1813944.1 bile acid:sodium symporter [Candidatus Competibacteraceae bacterium]